MNRIVSALLIPLFLTSPVSSNAANDLSDFFINSMKAPEESPGGDPQSSSPSPSEPSPTPGTSPATLFVPGNPHVHASWKGRKELPAASFRALVDAIVRYLGLPAQATQFLLEIAAAESDFGYYVRQVRGPALSVWQIEPATARDMHERLPRRNGALYRKILALKDLRLSEEENIVTNLNYGCAMCAGILYLKGIRFETLGTLEARAMAWKKHYNTYLGKGTLEGYCQKSQRHLGGRLSGQGGFTEPFDAGLLSGGDLFAERDRIRFKTLPPDFDSSPMGLYYARVLTEHPSVFEEIPQALFASQTVQDIAKSLLWQLIRQVQRNPASIGKYRDMPPEIFMPLVRAALEENAVECYPNLPAELQNDPAVLRTYEAHKFLLNHMP